MSENTEAGSLDAPRKSSPFGWITGGSLAVASLAYTGWAAQKLVTALPKDGVLIAENIPSSYEPQLYKKGVIGSEESLEVFYAEGDLSILEGGSAVTQERLVGWERLDGDLLTYSTKLDDITAITVEDEGTFYSPAWIHIDCAQCDEPFYLVLPGDEEKQDKFLGVLEQKTGLTREAYSWDDVYEEVEILAGEFVQIGDDLNLDQVTELKRIGALPENAAVDVLYIEDPQDLRFGGSALTGDGIIVWESYDDEVFAYSMSYDAIEVIEMMADDDWDDWTWVYIYSTSEGDELYSLLPKNRDEAGRFLTVLEERSGVTRTIEEAE